MKSEPLLSTTLDKFPSLFSQASDNRLLLDAAIGEGSVQIYKPEKGLQVSIWNCTFIKPIELHNHTPESEEHDYFNLAYFLDKQNLEVRHVSETSHKNISWDNMFVSDSSTCKLMFTPTARCQCISVSFSKRWLVNVLGTNSTLPAIDDIYNIDKLEVFQCMTQEERNMLENLVSDSTQNEFRYFYIKAAVFKLVYDFLAKLKAPQPAIASNNVAGILDRVEQCLCQHVTKEPFSIKAIAQQFSISESTLKRHFKKKFGVTVSAYLTAKKMCYAQELMQEKGITITEAARVVGYRNLQSFKEVFRKHYNCIPPETEQRLENFHSL